MQWGDLRIARRFGYSSWASRERVQGILTLSGSSAVEKAVKVRSFGSGTLLRSYIRF